MLMFTFLQDPSRTLPLSQLPDSRVDVCLWFIRPGIFPAEHAAIVAKLSQTIHVIPIIAKVSLCPQAVSATPLAKSWPSQADGV